MPKGFIDPKKCSLCHKCSAMQDCSVKAIVRIDQEYPPIIERRLCNACGDCVKVCPPNAITIYYE